MSEASAHSTDGVVLPAEVTNDFIYALFSEAYFNVHRDDVGDVYLKDGFTTWIFPQQDGEQIRLMAQFKANPEIAKEVKLEYANSVNDGFKLLRAYVDADDDIGFDYYIALEGGTTKRTIVLTVRRFVDYVRAALQRDEHNVIS